MRRVARKALALALLSAVVWASACGALRRRAGQGDEAQSLDPSKPPPVAELAPLILAQPEVHPLGNGVKLITAPSVDSALVHLRAVIDAGYGTEAVPGVATLSAAMATIEAGGYMSAELAGAVDRLGGDLTVTVGPDQTTLAITTTRDDLEVASALLATMLISPAAHPGAMEQAIERFARRERLAPPDPWLLLRASLSEALFKGRALGHSRPTVDQLRRISLEDIFTFRRAHWLPDRAAVLVLGDSQGRLGPIAELLAAWQGAPAAPPPLARPTLPDSGLTLIDTPGQTTARVVLGALSFPQGSLSAMAAEVLGQIVAGGPGSRLARVLSNGGIGVASVSFATLNTRETGTLELRLEVPPESVDRALNLSYRELDRVRQLGPTAEELGAAGRTVAARFLAGLSTQERIAALIAFAEIEGVGVDWWMAYAPTLDSLPPEDVRQVAAALLRTDRLVAIVAADTRGLPADIAFWRPPPPVIYAPEEDDSRK